MKHIVEIADSKGNTMQLSVSAETFGYGGSWRSLDKGFIRYNSGAIIQLKPNWSATFAVQLLRADGTYGIQLLDFISYGTVNDQGTGTLIQPWVLKLEPGDIDWSIV